MKKGERGVTDNELEGLPEALVFHKNFQQQFCILYQSLHGMGEG